MTVLCRLREDDVDALQAEGAALALGHIFPQDTHPFPRAEIRERWLREIADPAVDTFAITDADGALAGFAATRGDEFLHLGTRVDTWGTGLADAAHADVIGHMMARGVRRAWLRCFEENHRAVRFYARRGWVPTEQTSRTAFPPHPVLRRFELDLP